MLGNKIIKSILTLSLLFTLLNAKIYRNYRYPTEEIKQELLSKINLGIPEWMSKQIEIDFKDAPKYGITNSMLEQIISQDPEFVVKYSIRNGHISFSTRPGMTRADYSWPLLWVLEELSSYIKLPDVDLLFNVDDAPNNYENLIANQVPPIGKAMYLCPVLAPTNI